jgi:nicotinate-nucleotide pyrophosphorylase (carboxylating)
MKMTNTALREDIERYFKEDDLARNMTYLQSLPNDLVDTKIYIKSDMVLSGLPWFFAAFDYLGVEGFSKNILNEFEGKSFKKGHIIEMGKIPFSMALTGERIALNLLQRSSNISTFTKEFVNKAEKYNISILDTRKTTPGMRALEKYAVRAGGGVNHRFGQCDMWMVKDNHKAFFGGVKEAVDFFKNVGSFYAPLELEVHDVSEFDEAVSLGIKHVMLDNFEAIDVVKCIKKKPPGMTIELSGGVTLENLDSHLIEGVDAISIGSLTYAAPAVDISFKYSR